LKTLDFPLSARFGYMNTLETGVSVDGDFSIGDFSYINKNTHLSNVIIGKYTSISSSCNIGGAEHPISTYTTHPIIFNGYYGANKVMAITVKKTTIGNDVWIGHGVFIKQGVTISDGAVVAAGSVVTKSIPSYEVWGGVPAKKIKDRVVRNLPYGVEDWWNLDHDMVRAWEEY